uniref:Uncharacterized protein n=1 Tax=Seriola dumerili TaxID=41447 RepID=A0A3B4TGU3_SERDU
MLIIGALILLPLFIREDRDFQTVFIFPEGHCSHFITEFGKRQIKIQQLLKKLKDIAIRLDKVNKGIKIAYVAGSSVGAIGSVLSIVGLALSPLTLGASLPLTMAGLGMGIACGVSSAVTTKECQVLTAVFHFDIEVRSSAPSVLSYLACVLSFDTNLPAPPISCR